MSGAPPTTNAGPAYDFDARDTERQTLSIRARDSAELGVEPPGGYSEESDDVEVCVQPARSTEGDDPSQELP